MNVDSREFIQYVKLIGPHLQEYLRLQVTSQQVPMHIDLDSLSVSCYENVPSIFFDRNYRFNFESLVESKEEINERQEQLSSYLDEVDMNLFY